MSEKLSCRNGVVYVTFENGKCYRLESVLKRRRAEAVADEARATTTRRALWWRTHVVSRDLPNSRAANADLSDNGKGAATIRSIKTTYSYERLCQGGRRERHHISRRVTPCSYPHS